MKNVWVWALVIVAALAIFAFAGKITGNQSKNACTDSDGGKNYYTFGIVRDRGVAYPDSCLSVTKLKEGFCYRSRYNSIDYTCPYGCASGKCLPSGGGGNGSNGSNKSGGG